MGCNLGLDLDEYPYQGPLVINFDAGDEGVVQDAGRDAPPDIDDSMPPDMEPDQDIPVGSPQLVITELLINSKSDPSFTGEVGEYIEIKNIGDGPADPRAISFNIENVNSASRSTVSVPLPATTEQVKVYGELKDIQPGQYFVFIRFETAEVPLSQILDNGTFFDWGNYGQNTSLANSGERLLELRYFDGVGLQEFDRVRWGNNTLVDEIGMETVSRPLDENVALSVTAGSETSRANDAPAVWCQESEVIPGGSTTGTPGRIAGCQ